jgi:hypothetical protein
VATKSEITAGIQNIERHFDRLLPAIVANLDKPLPEGSWTVHDALCHIAADANAFARWQRLVDAHASGTSARPLGFNLDEHNEQGIAARKGKPVDDVVSEIREALRRDAAAVQAVDETLLQRDLPNFRGELGPGSDRLKFMTVTHNQIHLEDIEKAVTDRR